MAPPKQSTTTTDSCRMFKPTICAHIAPRFEKLPTPHQQNQALARRKPDLLFKSGMSGIFGQDSASVSAPDRLDRMEQMISTMLEAVKGTKAALAPLYAVFTEEQKKVADQLIHGPMGVGPM
jgi:hypothetical protein